jgi:hypothetical protein
VPIARPRSQIGTFSGWGRAFARSAQRDDRDRVVADVCDPGGLRRRVGSDLSRTVADCRCADDIGDVDGVIVGIDCGGGRLGSNRNRRDDSSADADGGDYRDSPLRQCHRLDWPHIRGMSADRRPLWRGVESEALKFLRTSTLGDLFLEILTQGKQ